VKALGWVFAKIFNMRNIIVPLKFLGSLLLRYRYVTREERKNNAMLEALWQAQGNTSKLRKKARLLGLSAMVLKSSILAIIGLITAGIFLLWKQRKQRALRLMQEQEEQKRKRILEEEWERIEKQKQPDLTVVSDVEALETSERIRQQQQ
jgi:flagellar biosynthesis component FlhA